MYPLTESQRGKMNRFDYIQILEKHLLPLINAPVHTAKDVKKWILMNKIKSCQVSLLQNHPAGKKYMTTDL